MMRTPRSIRGNAAHTTLHSRKCNDAHTTSDLGSTHAVSIARLALFSSALGPAQLPAECAAAVLAKGVRLADVRIRPRPVLSAALLPWQPLQRAHAEGTAPACEACRGSLAADGALLLPTALTDAAVSSLRALPLLLGAFLRVTPIVVLLVGVSALLLRRQPGVLCRTIWGSRAQRPRAAEMMQRTHLLWTFRFSNNWTVSARNRT